LALPKKLVKILKTRLGSAAVLDGAADRYVHAFDATANPILPDAVVVPNNAEDLAWACEGLWVCFIP
jgi:hypothetical protein